MKLEVGDRPLWSGRFRAAVAIMAALLICMNRSSFAAPDSATRLIIRGRINACYKMDVGLVRLTGLQNGVAASLSPLVVTANDGKFLIRVTMPARRPDAIFLAFGDKVHGAQGMGAARVFIHGTDTDVGIVGECDL